MPHVRSCILLLGFLIGAAPFLHAQPGPRTDSLLKRISGYMDDNDRMRTLLRLSDAYLGTDPLKVADYARQAIRMAQRLHNDSVLAHAQYSLGRSFDDRGAFDSSLIIYQSAYAHFKELNDTSFTVATATALGNTYYYMGNHKAGIRYHTQSLQQAQQWGSERAVANAHNNLGIIYSEQKFYPEALRHYRAARNYFLTRNEPYSLGSIELNIGNIYAATHRPDSAIYYFLKADSLFAIKADNPYAMALNWSNLGEAYTEKGELLKSRLYFNKAIAAQEELGDEFGLGYSYASLAKVELKEGHYAQAIELLHQTEAIGHRSGAIRLLEMAYNGLNNLHRAQKDWKRALEYYEKFVTYRDSVVNLDTRRSITALEAEFENQRKESELAQNALTIRRREVQLIASLIIVGLLIVLIVLIGMFVKRLRTANTALNQQKKLVEQANSELTDSIWNAERLQRATMPILYPDIFPSRSFFVLFRPRNIVSGDFYWARRVGKDRILMAVADCTGHGVPGALLSMVGYTTLDRCVKEFGLLMPDMILRKAHYLLQDVFNQSGAERGHAQPVRDGMDISICLIDESTRIMHYSGARGMGMIFSPHSTDIVSLKGDRFSIGDGPAPQTLTMVDHHLAPDDVVILYTDGITDQFGSDSDRKFTSARLKEWAMRCKDSTLPEMGRQLELTLNYWMDGRPQTDDITVIGFRV